MKLAVLALALCLFPAVAESARAQDHATVGQLDVNTTGSVFPGPGAGETRNVWVWRPPNAPANTRLPVLYMADGLDGIFIALSHLKAPIEAGQVPPILVISIDPKAAPEQRAAEYVRSYPGGGDAYPVH